MRIIMYPESWAEARALVAWGVRPHLPLGTAPTEHEPMQMGYYHHYNSPTFGWEDYVEEWVEEHPEAEAPPRRCPGRPYQYGWDAKRHGHLFRRQCPFRCYYPDLWRMALIQGHRAALSGRAVSPGDLAFFYHEIWAARKNP